MDQLRGAASVVCGVAVAIFAAPQLAAAQVELPPARAPCSVLSGRPCHPSFCGVFHRGPCFPDDGAPFGEDLRVTFISTDDNDPSNKSGDADGTKANTAGAGAENTAQDHPLMSVRAMFAALRGCWIPPPKDQARHGMEYTIRFAFKRDGDIVAPPRMTYASHDASPQLRDTYRDAIDAALKRCTPLHFSKAMAAAVTGHPIAIRFVDDRTIAGESGQH